MFEIIEARALVREACKFYGVNKEETLLERCRLGRKAIKLYLSIDSPIVKRERELIMEFVYVIEQELYADPKYRDANTNRGHQSIASRPICDLCSGNHYNPPYDGYNVNIGKMIKRSAEKLEYKLQAELLGIVGE